MSVKVTGLKELFAELKNKPQRVVDAIDADLTEGAELIEGRAKLLAPENTGLLKGTTIADTKLPLYKTVTSPEFYAPYQEFGTGKNFKANGRGTIAAQFRGKANRGSFESFVNLMLDYIPKHGGFPPKVRTTAAKRSYAEFVCFKIIKNGIKPANNGTGFFFRAYDEILPTILSNVRKSLKA